MEQTTLEKVSRLVAAATGEPYGDGYIVTNVVVGYSEPDYGSDDAVIVFGNWNPKRFPRGDDAPLSKSENIGPRLAAALEKVGAEIQWLDEWTECQNCYRAIRTEPDSYSWRPAFAWLDDCSIICSRCLLEDVNDSIESGEYVNNADKAITWTDGATLEREGWTQWAPGDPRQYENGWHPGQDDDPAAILAEILASDETAEVVFLISDVGQFDLRFVAYTRDKDEDEDE